MNILDIPQELLHLILLSMDIKSFVRFSRSCKFLNNTCQDNLIWKFFVEKDFKDFLLFPPRNVPASWLLKISRDFKKFYISSWNCTNLSGQWKAIYGSHGWELIEVKQRGCFITSTKLKGDVNVPTGQKSFECWLNEDHFTGEGKITLADVGFQNPRLGDCTIKIFTKNKFQVVWHHPLVFYRFTEQYDPEVLYGDMSDEETE